MADLDRFEDRLAMALADYADEAAEERGLPVLVESITARPQRRGLFARLTGAAAVPAPAPAVMRSAATGLALLLLVVALVVSLVAGVVLVGGWLHAHDLNLAPTASPAPTAVVTASPAPTLGATATPAITAPTDELIAAGSLRVCADVSQPVLSFTDKSGDPAGIDIDIASAIAERLSLRLEVVDTSFFTNHTFDLHDEVQRAVTGGTCDVVVAADPYGPGPIGRAYANVIPFLDRGGAVLQSIYVPLAHKALADTLDNELRSLVRAGRYDRVLSSWDLQSEGYKALPVDEMVVYYGLPTDLITTPAAMAVAS
jgi:ABC-type amino acid transport substrate-binding protein